MPLHVSGVTRPSSGGSAQLLLGVISCVGCVDCAVRRRRRCLLKAVQKSIERVMHSLSNRATKDEQITWYLVPLCTRHVKHDRRNVFQCRTNHCWDRK
jgi:hypothetical protein